MISRDISRHIMVVGPDHKRPKGGIAWVIKAYSTLMPDARYVATATVGSQIAKKRIFAIGLIKAFLLMLKPSIHVVHIHSSADTSFIRKSIVARMARLMGKKTIMHIHAGRFRDFAATGNNMAKIKKVLGGVDCIVALTPSWKEYFASLMPDKEIAVINNIIDEPVSPTPLKPVVGQPLRLLYLGLITDAKGIFDFVEMIAEHADDLRGKITLTIGGNGETQRLEQMIAKKGIGDIVTFVGWISSTDKPRYLNQSHALILPSYAEGLPLTLLEAMSYGRPVITTPVGGIPELVTDGVNGMLHAPGDKEAMYRIVTVLANDPSQLTRMSSEAGKSASHNMPAAVEQSLIDLYTRLL